MPKARPAFGGASRVCLQAGPHEEVPLPAPPSGPRTMRLELPALRPPLPGCKAQGTAASLPCTQNTRRLALLASSRCCGHTPHLRYGPLCRWAGSWGALPAAAPKLPHEAPKPPHVSWPWCPDLLCVGLWGAQEGCIRSQPQAQRCSTALHTQFMVCSHPALKMACPGDIVMKPAFLCKFMS